MNHPEDLRVVSAVFPAELSLSPRVYTGFNVCSGDDCNTDQGGCDAADASCGQDC